jgi:N-acetylglucosamine malate deacetylase 2
MSNAHGRRSDLILVIAHPDDEIFASGTLCLLAEKGLSITMVCMTDGEGGCRDLIHPQSGAPLAAIRLNELKLSGWTLGATEVISLGYADIPEPTGPNPEEWDENEVVSSLERVFREHDPELILTHGPAGGYGHPAHKVVHRHVMTAAARCNFPGTIFSFCGMIADSRHSRWLDAPSDVVIDASGFLHRRAVSLGYHQSQLGFFLQPYFPATLRDLRSTLLGYMLWFTPFGKKRIPVATTRRFFKRYPAEGLVLQKASDKRGSTYFLERFSDDVRIKVISQGAAASPARGSAGIPVLEQS